jgi:hypothetical protein
MISTILDSCAANWFGLPTIAQYPHISDDKFINKLKATGVRVGLLINFGRTKVEFKRMVF